jgi:hypothetical protein
MTSTATMMTDTLFEKGDDKRARLKLKPSYLDHLKALEQVHSKMQQSFKLLGISHAALVHQSSKKSHTNADIKRSRILVPSGKRNNPDEVRISASLADYNPQPKKKPKKNISTAISTEDKAKQFLQHSRVLAIGQAMEMNGQECPMRVWTGVSGSTLPSRKMERKVFAMA